MGHAIPTSSTRLKEERSPACRDCEVGDEAEMIAGPHTVDRLVKDACTGGDLQAGSSVLTTAHEDVINPSEWPVPISHKRVVRREGVARLSRMRALPGIPVADAHLAQRVTARPEAYTGCVRVGIEVADQYQVQTPSPSALLYDPRSGHRLQLALMLEVHLPIGKMVDEQQRTNRVWRQDLRDKRSSGEVPCSGCHV